MPIGRGAVGGGGWACGCGSWVLLGVVDVDHQDVDVVVGRADLAQKEDDLFELWHHDLDAGVEGAALEEPLEQSDHVVANLAEVVLQLLKVLLDALQVLHDIHLFVDERRSLIDLLTHLKQDADLVLCVLQDVYLVDFGGRWVLLQLIHIHRVLRGGLLKSVDQHLVPIVACFL